MTFDPGPADRLYIQPPAQIERELQAVTVLMTMSETYDGKSKSWITLGNTTSRVVVRGQRSGPTVTEHVDSEHVEMEHVESKQVERKR